MLLKAGSTGSLNQTSSSAGTAAAEMAAPTGGLARLSRAWALTSLDSTAPASAVAIPHGPITHKPGHLRARAPFNMLDAMA
jgi:hypothetical protein